MFNVSNEVMIVSLVPRRLAKFYSKQTRLFVLETTEETKTQKKLKCELKPKANWSEYSLIAKTIDATQLPLRHNTGTFLIYFHTSHTASTYECVIFSHSYGNNSHNDNKLVVGVVIGVIKCRCDLCHRRRRRNSANSANSDPNAHIFSVTHGS